MVDILEHESFWNNGGINLRTGRWFDIVDKLLLALPKMGEILYAILVWAIMTGNLNHIEDIAFFSSTIAAAMKKTSIGI